MQTRLMEKKISPNRQVDQTKKKKVGKIRFMLSRCQRCLGSLGASWLAFLGIAKSQGFPFKELTCSYQAGCLPSLCLPVLCRNSQPVSKEAWLFMESKPWRKWGAKGLNGFSWEAKQIRNGAELVTQHPGCLSHDITSETPLFLLRLTLLEKSVNWG